MEVFLDCAFLKMKSGHKNKQSKHGHLVALMDCRQLVHVVVQSQCCHHSFCMSADSAYWYPFLKINGICFITLSQFWHFVQASGIIKYTLNQLHLLFASSRSLLYLFIFILPMGSETQPGQHGGCCWENENHLVKD